MKASLLAVSGMRTLFYGWQVGSVTAILLVVLVTCCHPKPPPAPVTRAHPAVTIVAPTTFAKWRKAGLVELKDCYFRNAGTAQRQECCNIYRAGQLLGPACDK
jgi:hypothetical protein